MKWGNNNNKFRKIIIIEISVTKLDTTTKKQNNKSGRKWEHKEKDSKITLLHKFSHFVPAKFSESFFRQFDMAMHLKKEELKKQGRMDAKVSKVTKEDIIRAFGVTKDYMMKAAVILGKEENTKNLGNSSA